MPPISSTIFQTSLFFLSSARDWTGKIAGPLFDTHFRVKDHSVKSSNAVTGLFMKRLLWPVLALALWEILTLAGGIPAYILPTPRAVMVTLAEDREILWNALRMVNRSRVVHFHRRQPELGSIREQAF